jgi:hypothetical protein
MVPRRLPYLLILALGLPLASHAQLPASADSAVSPPVVAVDTTPSATDSASVGIAGAMRDSQVLPATDSAAFRASRLLVLPFHDTTGAYPVLRYVLRDAFLDLLIHDTLPRAGVLPGADTLEAALPAAADSFGRSFAAGQVIWSYLHHDSGKVLRLQAQRRDPFRDSLLAEVSLVLPDTAELALSIVPKTLLLGLFPRAMPPKPALTDSIKRVVLLDIVPEGTATATHSRIFTDSLAARLHGKDGISILPKALRDSLLGTWDPGQCLTESCRREVAERLGVPWIIAGRLVQLGDKWTVNAELLLADSAAIGRKAVAQGQGAPAPSLELVIGQTTRQLAGQEQPRSELSDAPIARKPVGPAWKRLLALGVAATLGVTGMILSW